MTEIQILDFLLFASFVVAPWMTQALFLKRSRTYGDVHRLSLFIILCGVLCGFKQAVLIWPAFCAYGFFLFIRQERDALFSAQGAASCIPFAFSLISATWLVAGVFDLHLLGYGPAWSFYAALHGAFLGWIFVGCVAFLARRDRNKIDLAACFLSLLFFLSVAFGIDGVPHVKRIGVVGFCLMAPFLIGRYAFGLKKENARAKALASLSLLAIVASMAFAAGNEFWPSFPKMAFGLPAMVLAHGIANALVAAPCFFAAIWLESRPAASASENVVLFDDLCVLCGGTVHLLVRLDRHKRLQYASLQGKFAETLPARPDVKTNPSVIFWTQGQALEKAEAAIRIFIALGGAYRCIGIALKIVPLFILDGAYDCVARSRYRIFGKNETCLMPTGELKNRFLP